MIEVVAVLSEIQRVTLENAGDGGVSWPSTMWTQAEVMGYLQQRQNRFLAETLLVWTVAETPILPGVDAQPRPGDWLARVQTAYRGGDNRYTLLETTDLRQLDLSTPNWPGRTTTGIPIGCYEAEGETLTDYLVPIPLDPQATLERYYVAVGTLLEPVAGSVFQVPDEFVPTLKYGVLAEMFSKVGPTANPKLAELAEARWAEGVAIGQLMSTDGWFGG